MHAELQELADTFSANRIMTGRAIRKLKESDPGGFHKAAILVLRESTEGPGTTYLLAMLLTRPEGLESIDRKSTRLNSSHRH